MITYINERRYNSVQLLKLQRRRYVHFGYNRMHFTAGLYLLLA